MGKEIGTVYGQIGTLEYDDETGLIQANISTAQEVPIHIQEIVQMFNADLVAGIDLVTAREEGYIMGNPASDKDLDTLEDSFALQSGGQVILRHDSPMLDQ